MNLKKTSVLVLFFMCSFPLAVFSDNQRPQTPILEGDWTGGFKTGERWTTYKVHFTTVNAVIKGTCELPPDIVQAEGAKTVDLANIALKGDRVHFEIPNKDGAVIFDGAFKEGELPGSFKKGTASGEAHLVKIVVLKPEAWAGYIGEYENGQKQLCLHFQILRTS